MANVAYSQEFQLAWSSSVQEDSRFRKILRSMVMGFAVIAIAVPFLPVPELTREQVEKIPPQLARVILEKQELVQPKPEPKPLKPKVVKAETKPKPKLKEIPKEKPRPKPVDLAKEARAKAAVAGVLAFQDDLMAMRDSIDVDNLTKSDLTRGEADSAKMERSMITSNVNKGSGGIQTANLSRDTGGVALSGRETTTIKSPIAGGGGNSPRSSNSAKPGGRSDESIRRIMDANKGGIFAIYNRALRMDPTLEGRLVFEMVIQPSGTVSSIKLLSSELGDKSLENKLLARIQMIRFKTSDVLKTRVNYSFDFLPF